MSFKIVTDSTVHLTDNEIAENDVSIIPLSTILNGEVRKDGTEKEKAQFLADMKSSEELPKSSQPPVGLFLDKYNELTADGSEVLSIHVTHTLSGTVDAAKQAAALADGKVTVIDSQYIARAMAFQILEAARCAKEGLSIEDTLLRLEEVKKRTTLYIAIVDLTNMIKGGRIGKTLGAVSQLLNLKVNLEMVEGALKADAKGRGTKKIIKRYEKIIAELKEAKKEIIEIGVTHDGMSAYSFQLVELLKQAFPQARLEIAHANGSVMTHAGPDAVSIQFLEKKVN
ncbi:DegV family protein [Lacticigenium naphthae]|uniref:DegV family protein n=1 Tax=Lacticigenium naphthae TaxID=515351 RepID=UPI000423E86D|nr:DegV family protein [Lacticigenium naphthae]